MSKHFPGRKLSIPRLALVVLLAGALVGASFAGWGRFTDTRAAADGQPWFAGYVDATATPFYPFETPATEAGGSVVLSFIVADAKKPCEPSWGGYYGFDDAAATMDLDRRIARYTQEGGEVVISFGGLLNDELATSCTNVNDLVSAYRSVIERYEVSTLDFDIEGENLEDAAAGERRAQAVSQLQKEFRQDDKPLNVWLTLPVAPTGLTEVGTTAVTQFLDASVDLAGVNIMTMDYGASRTGSTTMFEASKQAAVSTHRQLGILYERAGINLGPQTLWGKVGITPMIGQNDVVGEVFDLDAAEKLNAFAREKGVGRMSMWSLNRDATCSANYPDLTVVSDSCSGVDQQGRSFAEALGNGFSGRGLTLSTAPTTSEPSATATATTVVDDPETSPYPIWFEDATYVEGERVVWHGNVYEAKWWTKEAVPDNPVLKAEETPWQLIGPVLPGETPLPEVTVPAGTFPDWDAEITYLKGSKILFDGHAFEAKWWSKGDSPQAALQGSDSSAWSMLKDETVLQQLENGTLKTSTATDTATDEATTKATVKPTSPAKGKDKSGD